MTTPENKKQIGQGGLNIIQVTSAVFLAILIGWLIVIGKSLLLPIFIGVISVYILTTAAEKLQGFPLVGSLSQGSRRAAVGFIFLAIVVLFTAIVSANAQAISDAIPKYSDNFNELVQEGADFLGLSSVPSYSTITAEIEKNVSVSDLLTTFLSGLTGAGAFLFAAFLYAVFLLADWNDFPRKTKMAFGNESTSEVALRTARAINRRIGDYLAAKTLINLILGTVSFAVMWMIGIEFALFWAILIALLNYIPYFGSIAGVIFPVMLALVQFGGFVHAGIAFLVLMAVQLFVGNVLEPRILGKSVNMSAIVFMIALSFWMSVWGLAGAILAIPLTAMIMIILAEISNAADSSIDLR